jgi:hypothetical protein
MGRYYIKLLKNKENTNKILEDIRYHLTWFRKDREGQYRGDPKRDETKRKKEKKVLELAKSIGIEEGCVIQVIVGRWRLEKAIAKSKSAFLEIVDKARTEKITGGPKLRRVKSTSFGLTKRLPGSFEGSKKH